MNKGIRIRAAVLIVIGTGLAVFMAWLIDLLGPIMQPGGSPSGARFTGTAEQGWWISALLLSVLALGIVAALYGLFMAITGRESKVVRVAALVLLLFMLGAALALGYTGRVPRFF